MDKIAIIGLPLAVEFGKKYQTIGIDINEARVEELNNGYDRTLEVDEKGLKSADKLTYTTIFDDTKDCNIYIVTVPTPINAANRPDLTPIKMLIQSIEKRYTYSGTLSNASSSAGVF